METIKCLEMKRLFLKFYWNCTCPVDVWVTTFSRPEFSCTDFVVVDFLHDGWSNLNDRKLKAPHSVSRHHRGALFIAYGY